MNVTYMEPKSSDTTSESAGTTTIARLVLVGEYNLFRECLASMLAKSDLFTVTAQATSLDEAQERLAEGAEADVVLYDVGRPTPERLEAIREFTDAQGEVKLIALGLDEVESDILKFIEAGACAYVLKEVSVNELGQLIERVMRGEAVCSPKIISSMFSRLADLARSQRQEERLEALNLTPRELEILQLVAAGYSNKEIAAELYLSFHTVKNHVHNILEKLKVQHRSEAVEYAYKKRWLRARRKRSGERR